jgi:uncharacterized phage protein (TIGR01671 family)
MSREFKFRGKRMDSREWIIGSLYQDYDMPESASIIPLGSLEYKNGTEFRIIAHDVDYKTVGQYTGLKDKNGQEIYEGDIIYSHHIEDKKAGPVAFSNIHHGYIINYPPEKNRARWQLMHGKEHCYEVIGNIHENLELLLPGLRGVGA